MLLCRLVHESKEEIMDKRTITIFACAVFLVFSPWLTGVVTAAKEEILMGYVVKHGNRFVIEADDGDYIVRGKDVSKLVDRLVEANGVITESDKEDIIEVKSITDIQDTIPE